MSQEMYFDLEKAQLIPVPDELEEIPKSDITKTTKVVKIDEKAEHVSFGDDPFDRDLIEAGKTGKSDKPKQSTGYRMVPLIIYIVLSIIILFCFLINVTNATMTLIYCLLQALWVIAISCVIYWLSSHDGMVWAWIVIVFALIIQALWVTMVVIY